MSLIKSVFSRIRFLPNWSDRGLLVDKKPAMRILLLTFCWVIVRPRWSIKLNGAAANQSVSLTFILFDVVSLLASECNRWICGRGGKPFLPSNT